MVAGICNLHLVPESRRGDRIWPERQVYRRPGRARVGSKLTPRVAVRSSW
jgi:hypothetical protein